MKRRNLQKILPNASTPSTNVAENTGIKDQNLFLDQATLNVDGSVDVENFLETRDLKVADTITSPCEFTVGGALSAESSQFKATTLSRGLEITSEDQNGRVPKFINVSDPQSPRDALTYNYYRNTGCQALNMYTFYDGLYSAQPTTVGKPIEPVSQNPGPTTYHTSASAKIYDAIGTTPYVEFKAPGIYQVTIQVLRDLGQHSGNDYPNLYLNLMIGNNKTLLCASDTRGYSGGHRTSVAVTGTFTLTEIVTTPPRDYPWLFLETTIGLNIKSMSTCIIWFPFQSNFAEVD
ncbi:conserved hypothetical protein [Chlamydia pneumoniae LPCoLN]|uniref:hypothetical protein n=1 Tax=Chlamydia pneumoniae TaxID=83558 RepID=UPI0001BD9CBD|nr:hypothetical protein [Chlamydia pneumoniae]ACZ33234.1 conserved hypothetical protein [Chlamydia pneumoniae LPCoLN]ETR80139.1 hypothetical protein X556_0543 [Chlamydia pneumoniae B21]